VIEGPVGAVEHALGPHGIEHLAQGGDTLAVDVEPRILVAERQREHLGRVARTRVSQHEIDVGKAGQGTFQVTWKGVAVGGFGFDAGATCVEDHRQAEPLAGLVDLHHIRVVGIEALHRRVQLHRACPGGCVPLELRDALRISRVDGGSPQQPIAGTGTVDGRHPTLAEVVSEGQPECDRQDQGFADPSRIHFGEQIRDRLGRSSRAAPGELREGALAQLPQVSLSEVRVDVDIQVELAAWLLRVAIEQVLSTLAAHLQVYLGSQEQRHAEVAVDVDRAGNVVRHAAQLPAGIELEPRQLGEPPIAAVALGAEGPPARAGSLDLPLSCEPRDVGLGVSLRIRLPAAPGQRDAREAHRGVRQELAT
jgi:hypothetical protein